MPTGERSLEPFSEGPGRSIVDLELVVWNMNGWAVGAQTSELNYLNRVAKVNTVISLFACNPQLDAVLLNEVNDGEALKKLLESHGSSVSLGPTMRSGNYREFYPVVHRQKSSSRERFATIAEKTWVFTKNDDNESDVAFVVSGAEIDTGRPRPLHVAPGGQRDAPCGSYHCSHHARGRAPRGSSSTGVARKESLFTRTRPDRRVRSPPSVGPEPTGRAG